jgi:hypothetical protein
MNHPDDPACNLVNEETEEDSENQSGLMQHDDSGSLLSLYEEANDKGKKNEFSEIVEHGADNSIPSWLEKILQELQQHPMIWRHPPKWIQEMLFINNGADGTRIIMVDFHGIGSPKKVWHLNSDLRLLQGINHKDITPFLMGLASFVDSFPKFPDIIMIFPYPLNEGIDSIEEYWEQNTTDG